MTTFLTRHRAILALLALGLALRVVLAFAIFPMHGFAGDLDLFWQWARTLAASGPGTFYASTGSADYPPAYLYALWLLGLTGEPALLKLPPILADPGIAAIVYALAVRWRGRRTGLVAAALFLFLPVSWYDSALWGQVDAVGTLVAVAALLLLVEGWSEAALATAVLAVLVKPQYAITLGVVIPVLVRRHLLRPGSGPAPRLGRRLSRLDAALGGLLRDQGPRRLVSSAATAGLVAVLVIMPFDIATYAPASLADLPVIAQVAGLTGLFGRLGNEYPVLAANAFNPWALVAAIRAWRPCWPVARAPGWRTRCPCSAGSLAGGWLAAFLVVVAGVVRFWAARPRRHGAGAARLHDPGPRVLRPAHARARALPVPVLRDGRHPGRARDRDGARLRRPGAAQHGEPPRHPRLRRRCRTGRAIWRRRRRLPGRGSRQSHRVRRWRTRWCRGLRLHVHPAAVRRPCRSELLVTASALGLGTALVILLGTWAVVILRHTRGVAEDPATDPEARERPAAAMP